MLEDYGHQKIADWDLIPEDNRRALSDYLTWGQPMPSFLTAIVSNDFLTAAKFAGAVGHPHFYSFAKFLHNHADPQSYGSPEKAREWIQGGGAQGRIQRATG